MRLILSGDSRACMNMAYDEAVVEAVSKGASPPTLRLYGWEPHAVSIGYFQSMGLEVDTGECESLGVDVVRRLTGGGAVYHDQELTYSVVMPKKELPDDILESYRLLCAGVIGGLSNLGIESSFAPLNDIVSQDRKISGNAQTRRMGCVLQHGTILLDVDVDRMFSLLKVPDEKARGRLLESVKSRVTSVSNILGEIPKRRDIESAIADGFERSLDVKLEPADLTFSEKERAAYLSTEKYSQQSWNNRR